MHEPEEEDNPQILAQATLEAQAGGVMLDDGRLLHVIDPDRGTFQEYLRISLSRLHPILLYQYFHDDPAQARTVILYHVIELVLTLLFSLRWAMHTGKRK